MICKTNIPITSQEQEEHLAEQLAGLMDAFPGEIEAHDVIQVVTVTSRAHDALALALQEIGALHE